jgi:hypothetical protein
MGRILLLLQFSNTWESVRPLGVQAIRSLVVHDDQRRRKPGEPVLDGGRLRAPPGDAATSRRRRPLSALDLDAELHSSRATIPD